MAQVSEQQVLDALRGVVDRDRGQDVVGLGMVQGLRVQDGHVAFALQVDPARGPDLEPLRKEAETAVHGLPGVLTASVVLTADRPPASGPAPQQRAQAAPGAGPGHAHGPAPQPELLADTGAIIAVASGKGGVGKSTTAVNIALGLSALGLRVGILDADIYGPSIPHMLGISGKPHSDGDKLDPMRNFGVVCMSIGFLVEEDTPMIWRGPMVMSALEQMLRDVRWGTLDVLVLDMPPGTGDAQLTISQRIAVTGAVIVSTPQDVALIDARKGLNMFRRVEIPVLGLIENMSYFLCPSCGERSEIFGHGGARETAAQLGMDFLGEVPLHMAIRETSDAGAPIVATQPDSPQAKAYLEVAAMVAEKIDAQNAGGARKPPRIVVM